MQQREVGVGEVSIKHSVCVPLAPFYKTLKRQQKYSTGV